MMRSPRWSAGALAAAVLSLSAPAQGIPSIEEFTGSMTRLDGFVPLCWDAATGKLFLEVPSFDEELLYVVSLSSGLGSNPVGLDRGSLGPQHVVAFRRSGPKVLLVAQNLRYRALSDDPNERTAVADSFAPSVLWGFEVVAESDGRALCDATAFALRDAADAAARVKGASEGSYTVDASRSAVHLPRTKAFADNTEIEVLVTFTSGEAGRQVSRTAASGKEFSVRQRHSLIRLPDGYRPRRADPRVGFSAIGFKDSVP